LKRNLFGFYFELKFFFSRQIHVYKEQVQQFSKTIIDLEKNLSDEQQKFINLQTEFDLLSKNPRTIQSTTPVETIVPIVPVIATSPIVDVRFANISNVKNSFEISLEFSHEMFTYKSRVQEQEQIIISLRRDLAGMTARLSDVQGELSEKQKRALEKSEFTIREQTKELNETRLKLSKLSDIVDKQSKQVETLQTDLSFVQTKKFDFELFHLNFSSRKSKTLANQYQLLVDQRQADIDRLNKSLEQQNLVVQRVEQANQNEVSKTNSLLFN